MKIVLASRIGTRRAFHTAGPDIEKAPDPVLVFISLYEEQQIYLYLWSVDILCISAEQVRQPDMQVGCVLGF